jgi:Xaa-Pro aminopeptidase
LARRSFGCVRPRSPRCNGRKTGVANRRARPPASPGNFGIIGLVRPETGETWMLLVTPESFSQRRLRVSAELAGRKLDCLVVTGPPNVRYLSGYTGSNGIVLLWRSGAILFTDPRYEIQAAQETDCRVVVATGPLLPEVAKAARKRRFRRIGFERGRISYDSYEALRGAAGAAAKLLPTAGWIEKLRMVKSATEIEAIRASVLLNSEAFERAVKKIAIGMTETDLAAEIEYQMRLLGAQKPAFDTIVASGARTALCHAQPGSDPIRNDRLLLVDMGASLGGYASDMTRMLFPGRPGKKVKELYRAVLDAQLAGIAAVRAGVTAGDVDRATRQVLDSAGLGEAFVHSTGHGLGLEIHEAPRLGKKDTTELAAGMAITIEPGVYIEGFGGIRIEDTVVVTANGCEILTPTQKDLRLI